MNENIVIKEDIIENVLIVNKSILEFDEWYNKNYFEDRYKNSEKLILVTYVDDFPAWYMVSYNKNNDWSFYCWMTWVNPSFRKLWILTKMMEYLFTWARENWYKKISIKTRNNRREMLSFLVKNWFYFTEVQSFSSIEENRILLEKNII